MKKIVLFVGFIMVIPFAGAQISEGGYPASFKMVESYIQIPVVLTPEPDMAKIAAEDTTEVSGEEGYRFGIDFYYKYDITDSGIWTDSPTGEKIWRLKLMCKNARSVSFTFDRYRLPPGGKLFAYSADKHEVLGAFTEKNNQEDGYFAVSLIMGDEVIIEYNHPEEAPFFPELRLWRITHGYRGPGNLLKSFGSSGSCQVNVKCPEGEGWEDQIRSVCAILDGGFEKCTGALINNVACDGTPYVLTANHCYSNPGSWVFWFNWESPTCENPTGNPVRNVMSGATLKARYLVSDFCLVQLNNTPPASYNVYYSGWSRSTDVPLYATCIHHPSIDIKKISKANFITAANYDGYFRNTWRVIWASACTEKGSSGSPLFDQDKRIVGQLWGGESYCGASASEMNDSYGRFDLSWNGGGSITNSLKNWLDPGQTNVQRLDGYDPGNSSSIPVSENNIFTIFPNPASETATIRFSESDLFTKTVEILDVTGKIVYESRSVRDFTINLATYSKGIYCIRVTAGGKIFVKKLVIQ